MLVWEVCLRGWELVKLVAGQGMEKGEFLVQTVIVKDDWLPKIILSD